MNRSLLDKQIDSAQKKYMEMMSQLKVLEEKILKLMKKRYAGHD